VCVESFPEFGKGIEERAQFHAREDQHGDRARRRDRDGGPEAVRGGGAEDGTGPIRVDVRGFVSSLGETLEEDDAAGDDLTTFAQHSSHGKVEGGPKAVDSLEVASSAGTKEFEPRQVSDRWTRHGIFLLSLVSPWCGRVFDGRSTALRPRALYRLRRRRRWLIKRCWDR
jgi:hypothetical protein